MHKEYHRWYTQRLGLELGLVVYGHWGPPLIAFPTSAGDEWELEHQGLIGSLADLIDGGRVKFFCVNSANFASFYDKHAHPFHRSYMQAQFDAYVRFEVVPFVQDHCQSFEISISTMGLSGVYDIRNFMNGMYDDNTYFNNPVDYLSNLSDSNILAQLHRCDIHIATGCGPWENGGPSHHLSSILVGKGIPHHLDDWGEAGGHDWPYWKNQMRPYNTQLF